MPSENAAAEQPSLPRELLADHSEFLLAIAPLVGRGLLSQATVKRLTEYGHRVYARAARVSLIAGGDRPSVYTRHILDSLNPLSLFHEPPVTAIDVGSGGGFPGIPLALAWPETMFTLLESRERKAGFLELAIREMKIRNARVVCARLEDVGRSWSSAPQAAAFVRAVGGLSGLLETLSRVSSPGARWIYFLGGSTNAAESVAALGVAGRGAKVEIGSLGGRLLTGSFSENQ